MTVATKFEIESVTEHDECLYVAGSGPLLGNWDPEKGIPLEKKTSNATGESNTWSCIIDLPAGEDYQYRYYVCRFLDAGKGERKLTVVRWESNFLPRTVSTKNASPTKQVSEFGNYGGYHNVSRGWLMGQVDTQIRLHSNPIYMWKRRYRTQLYWVKCVPMDYRLRDPLNPETAEDDESQECPPPCTKTTIQCFSLKDKVSTPSLQSQYGHLYKDDDFLVFQSQSMSPEYLGYQLEFYVDEPDRLPRYIGSACVLPLNQTESQGNRKIPIMGLKHKPIGEVTVEYIITKPFKDYKFDLELSYRNYWKNCGRSLDVGHRGMGASYKKVALVRENTVASLSSAGSHGADMVEFDVMLCKDHKPVVYHDFRVGLLHRKRDQEKDELLEIPVKDLTFEQLQSFKLYHASSSAENHIHLSDEASESEDLQPFPTLQQCLERVPLHIGFNIEIKHPQQDATGAWEQRDYFDHNLHVDTILDTVLKHAGERRIILASFDADTCIMMQLKQNKYPVLFLSQGATKIYTPYMDFRARDFVTGIKFAQAHGLLGIDLHCEGVLEDLSIIDKTRDAGLVLFVWGEHNNSLDTINLLRQKGVDGIIYDRIDFHKSGKGRQFVLEDDTEILQDISRS